MDIVTATDERTGAVRVLVQDWVPLNQASLCLDCQGVFRAQTACPSCGSRTWTLLSKWLEQRKAN